MYYVPIHKSPKQCSLIKKSSVPHICSEMYCEVIRTSHNVSQLMACGVCTHAVSCDGWSEHHTANGCAHTGNQFIPIFGVRISLLSSNSVKGKWH